MTKLIDLGRTTYIWVPTIAAIKDVTKPKLSEISPTTDPDDPEGTTLTGGSAKAYNISEMVINSTEIMAAASDTTNERSVVAMGNAKVPTIGNYSGQLNLFRDALATLPTGATSVWSTEDLAALFPTKGLDGWIIKRTGLPWRAPLAAQQTVEVYGFVTDTPVPTGGKQDGYLKLMIPMLPTGDFCVNAVVQPAS